MSRRNKNTPGGGASLDNGGAAVATEILSQIAPLSTPTRRRLDPRIGALAKLDVCEHRLHVANTTGDSDTWSRFYLAWLRLHELAFSYGKWAREAADG